MPSWVLDFDRLVFHPYLNPFSPRRRFRVIQFLALSCRYEAAGVVTLYDDEICKELDLSLDVWTELRDEMILRKICRKIASPLSRPTYEVNPIFIQRQSRSQDGRYGDGRSDAPWTGVPEFPETHLGSPAAPVVRTGPFTQVERNALYNENLKRLANGERRILGRSTEGKAWLENYRRERYGPPTSEMTPEVTPEVTLNAEKNVMPDEAENDPTDRNGDVPPKPPIQTNSNQPSNNNKREGRNGGPERNVTVGKDVVVTLLCETGITLPDGEQHTFSRAKAEEIAAKHKAARINLWLEWLPFYDFDTPVRNWEGVLMKAIEEEWKCPPRYREEQNARNGREQRKREQEAKRQSDALLNAEEAKRVELLEAWAADLLPERQAELEAQTVARLSDIERQKYERSRGSAGPVLIAALKKARLEILAEWRKRPPEPADTEPDDPGQIRASLAFRDTAQNNGA